MRLDELLNEQDDGDKKSDYDDVEAWKKDAKSSDYEVTKETDDDGNDYWKAKTKDGKKVGCYYIDDENGWLN